MSVPSVYSNRINPSFNALDEIESQVLDLSAIVYTLSGSVQSLILNDLSDELNDLSGRVEVLDIGFTGLTSQVLSLSNEVLSISGIIHPLVLTTNGLTSQVSTISGRLDGLSLEFDAKQNDFAGLSSDLYILESQVLGISGLLYPLDNQFTNLSGYSYSLGNQVSTISGKLIDLSNYVDSFSPATPNLQAVLTAGQSAGGIGINLLGDTDATAFLTYSGILSANDSTLVLDSGNGTGIPQGGLIDSYSTLNSSVPKPLLLQTAYSPGGIVGIGHSSPTYTLDVSGNTRISSRLGINTTPTSKTFDMNGTFNMTNGTRTGTHPSTLSWYATADIGAESSGFQFGHLNGTTGVGIGFSGLYMAGSTANLPMNINSKGTSGILLKPGGTTRATLTSTGLGIGTTSPSTDLHIVKGSNFPEIATQYSPGGQLLIQGCGSAGAYLGYSGYLTMGSCGGTQLSGFTDLFRFTTTGRLGIGRTSPGYQLELSLDSAGKPSTGVWTITSDKRVKENIVDADLSRCYEIVKNLPLKHYKWKDEYYTNEQIKDRSKLGWIADEVESYFPKGVNTISDWIYKDEVKDSSGNIIEEAKKLSNIKTLNSDQIYAVMYGAIQKLIQTTENLSKEVEYLKSKIV